MCVMHDSGCPMCVRGCKWVSDKFMKHQNQKGPVRFQARCRRRQLNLALVFVFILCCSTFLLTGKCAFVMLVHGQVTIIFVVYVCLFVCAEFFSAVFDPISITLGYMLYVWV